MGCSSFFNLSILILSSVLECVRAADGLLPLRLLFLFGRQLLELVACAYADEEAHNDPYMEQVVDEHVGLDTDIDEHEQRVKDENDQSK